MSRVPPASPEEARFLEELRVVDRAVFPDQLEVARVRTRLGARAWKRARRGARQRFVWAGALLFAAGGAFALGSVLEESTGPSPKLEPPAVTDVDAPRTAASPAAAVTPPEEAPRNGDVPPASTHRAPTSAAIPATASGSTTAAPRTAWTSVARALRSGDRAEAERQLVRLVNSSQGAEGDSARLALAQLRLSSGNAAGARGLLERLARSSADPLIAARARELLERPVSLPRNPAP